MNLSLSVVSPKKNYVHPSVSYFSFQWLTTLVLKIYFYLKICTNLIYNCTASCKSRSSPETNHFKPKKNRSHLNLYKYV